MSRSLKKKLYTCPKLLAKVIRANEEGRTLSLKIWTRSSTIYPEMIGHNFLIHNGKKFNSRDITQDMVGFKFGVFSPTRNKGTHGKAGKR
jgi:small subunit ribosomal protein S19